MSGELEEKAKQEAINRFIEEEKSKQEAINRFVKRIIEKFKRIQKNLS
jgi:hypothetical protein